MKRKVLIIFLIVLLFTGCQEKKEIKVKKEQIIDKDIAENEEKVNTYKDNNPIKLSLYVDKKKITEYNSPMTKFKDIVSLECYYTEDDNLIDGKVKETFSNYYKNYQNIDKYKIGYYIKFKTTDGDISKYIYRPSDVESFFNYIQVYLYDDIHQNTSWYDHISNEEYNENTLLTSIKLTASIYIEKVTSNVEVTAFTYTPDDINEKNEYIGNSKYSVSINKTM